MMRVVNIAMLLLIVVGIYLSAMGSRRQNELAQQGAESHRALCVFRDDLQRRADDSRAFLALTPEERIEKYGTALGTIPPSVLRNSLSNQQQTLDSLSSLDCS